MKLYRTLIIAGLVLLSAGTAKAQQSRNLSEIEDSFVDLMRFSAANASNETRQLHLRVLGKAYDQYILAVDNEMKILRALLEAARNISSDEHDEIAKAIKNWEGKKEEARKDIQKFASSVNSTSSATAASSASPPANNNSSSHPAPQAETGTPGRANATPNSTNRTASSSSSIASANPKTATICGQVSLASLAKVQALIQAAKSDLKNEIFQAVKTQEEIKIIENLLADGSDLHHSRLGDVCRQEDWRKLGAQRRSAIRLLRATRSLLPALKKAGVTGASDPDISEDWLQKQILLLEEYLGNVAVHIRNDKGALIKTAFTDKDGNFNIELKIPAADCDNLAEEKSYGLTTEGDNNYTKRRFVPVCEGAVRVNLPIEDRPVSHLIRAVVGYQQTAAAASRREQSFFFDFFASKSFPIVQRVDPNFGERLKVWGAIRVSSVPQSGDLTIGDATVGFASEVSKLKLKDAARVFDFLTGVEILLTGNPTLLPSFDRKTRMKFALSFIAGGGVVTPEEPKERLESFKYPAGGEGLPQEIKALVDDEQNTDYLTFVPKDRDRFFRQYYAGFRLQSFYFNRYNVPIQRFPAQLDLTVGQNEYVSGGHLRGAVFRIDSYFPLPFEEMRFINLFGTAIMRPGTVRTSNPLILETADGIKFGAKTVMVPYEHFNRDYYRVGVGIDFIDFVGKLKDALKK